MGDVAHAKGEPGRQGGLIPVADRVVVDRGRERVIEGLALGPHERGGEPGVGRFELERARGPVRRREAARRDELQREGRVAVADEPPVQDL